MATLDLDIIGTHLQIRVDTSSPSHIGEDFSRIERYLTDFEAKYSRFIPGNYLHTLNQNRGGILDHDAKVMLSYALDLARKTDGYFDPTVGKRLRDLGYGHPDTVIRTSENIFDDIFASGDDVGDYRDVEIWGDTLSLGKKVEIECGGVGKGYLIDQIRGMLEGWNVGIFDSGSLNTPTLQHSNTRYLINFGGDLYGRGGWKVGLESPFAPDEVIGLCILDDISLACSAGTKRKWGGHHHLIDPKTGASAGDVIATYIESSSAMVADAYATALSVMPWPLACTTLESTPEISGVLVRHDRSIYQKEGSRCEIFV